MRVIAGKYRGRILKSPADSRTRPTSDRLRETLFNIIAPRIDSGTRFLDLCSGTGAVGIESLSRGAGFAAFVDRSRRSCALIEQNLDLLGIPESETEVICATAENFLSKPPSDRWDVIFFDPPYEHDYSQVIHQLGHNSAEHLTDHGIFIAEHHSKNILPDLSGAVRRWRIVRQGETWLSLYEQS